MKTLTSLRRAGYPAEATQAKRQRNRIQRHAWRQALPWAEPQPTSRWLGGWMIG